MKVGDLVRIVNEWRGLNPWMKFPDENPKIGLIIGLSSTALPNTLAYRVLVDGSETSLPSTRLEPLKASNGRDNKKK